MILNKNNNIKKKIIIPFSILSITTLLSLIGKSSYVLPGNEIDLTIKEDKDVKPVCYIDSNKDIKYTSIEKALEVANKMTSSNPIIYIIPGTTHKLENDTEYKKIITINKNVTLSLPYSNELTFSTYSNTSGEQVANGNEALLNSDLYRVSQVIIGENVSIINNGTIKVGGIVGSQGGGNSPAGQTCDKFSEIVCEGVNDGEYQIINNGNIENFGRIIGKNRDVKGIENNSNSIITTNFVVRENKGGSALLGLGGGYSAALGQLEYKVSPFNRVYMPNTMVKMKINYASKIIGRANMYGNSTNNVCDINIVSNENKSLIELKNSNSYLLSETYLDKLLDKNNNIIFNQYEKMKLDFYGEININNLEMTISASVFTKTINTNSVLFPLSYYHDISFNSINNQKCSVVLNQNLKILPGGSMNICENIDFSIDKIAVYDNFQDNIGWAPHKYPSNLNSGKLFIGGNFTCKSEAGGDFVNSSNCSSLNITNNTITCKEVKGTPGTSVDDSTYDNILLTASGIQYENNSFVKKNLMNNTKYVGKVNSNNFYWQEKLFDITDVSIVSEDGKYETGKNEAGKFNLTANVSPEKNLSNDITYLWTCDKGNNYLTSTSDKTTTLNIPAHSGDGSTKYNVTCTVKFTRSDGTSGEVSTTKEFTAKGSCITSNTLILMSNGTYKKAIDIRANDLVMSINHETGKIEPTPIVFNDHIDKEADIYDVLSLEFSNDKTVEVVYEHGFFDLDTNKYEYITLDNYQYFIGHRFVSVDYINGKFIKGIATLNKGYITNKFTRICSPVTYKNLNIITENMLSMPGGISGLFNIFEYDKNLAYDQVKENEDINKYGLLDYSYFNNLIPYEVYEAFNGKYLKVAMGKGILTKKQLNNYIERYLPIISKQNNCH